jgi:hypothetical protein
MGAKRTVRRVDRNGLCQIGLFLPDSGRAGLEVQES